MGRHEMGVVVGNRLGDEEIDHGRSFVYVRGPGSRRTPALALHRGVIFLAGLTESGARHSTLDGGGSQFGHVLHEVLLAPARAIGRGA